MKIVALWLVAILIAQANVVGVVKKLEGNAKVQHEHALKQLSIQQGAEVMAGDTLLTYQGSKVVVELADKSSIVVDEYAKLTLLSQDEFTQNGGKVYFKITKRKGATGVKVNTPFAIIGVKGTQFVVTDANSSQSLALNEGLVGVDSPDGSDFEKIDEDKVKKMMAQTPNQVMAEFEAYKKELYKEFAEYTASFDLKAGKKLQFNGKQVLESTMESEDSAQFKLYMSDAEFNAISKELEKSVTGKKMSADEAFSDGFFKDENDKSLDKDAF
ncbi:MAG: hypothetical protein KU28_00980 [Sulfurovum sp. PC08-66]|nr:MAG: hypothetical protein KU28_00980 [Sulfurovum sp. PC08-66]KIM12531.1 MAG: hypothetical protein KU37_01095 [Sulfuricurvum sp. PC08-66]